HLQTFLQICWISPSLSLSCTLYFSLLLSLSTSLSLFFFSSRRRHTTSKRDWSSDVCSSDLNARGNCRLQSEGAANREDPVANLRSEERRVGKECRTLWRAYRNKNDGCKNVWNIYSWYVFD